MIEKFNTQEDMGPLEELTPFLKNIKNSKGLLIAAGATAYTEFGKKNFLKKGDEIFVYVYNAHFHSFEDIMQDMSGMDLHLSQCSKLHQIVE
jgi:regulator of sigma D